jgi:hypothetical protein
VKAERQEGRTGGRQEGGKVEDMNKQRKCCKIKRKEGREEEKTSREEGRKEGGKEGRKEDKEGRKRRKDGGKNGRKEEQDGRTSGELKRTDEEL